MENLKPIKTNKDFSKIKSALLSGLLQILPVMFGVYLGFALNNFSEQKKTDRQKNVYEQMLKNEIQDNLEEIKKASIYHDKITKDFRTIANSKDIKTDFNDYTMTGLRPGMVNSSAYNTGIQTGIIQEFDLKIIQNLNKLYNYQRKYDTYNEQMLNSFLTTDFPETEQDIKNLMINLSMGMNDVENFERELQQYYQLMLDKLNE
jgi:hypothetical protein